MSELPPDLQDIVAYALKEDVGGGDITAALIPERSTGMKTSEVLWAETTLLEQSHGQRVAECKRRCR